MDLLDKLAKETKSETKQLKVNDNNDAVIELIKMFSKLTESNEHPANSQVWKNIKIAKCTAPDIELFSKALVGFQYRDMFCDWAGRYISKLIEHCDEKNIFVHTKDLSVPIWFYPYYDGRYTGVGKSITIEGDVQCIMSYSTFDNIWWCVKVS